MLTLNSLAVNIDTFCCWNINVFDNRDFHPNPEKGDTNKQKSANFLFLKHRSPSYNLDPHAYVLTPNPIPQGSLIQHIQNKCINCSLPKYSPSGLPPLSIQVSKSVTSRLLQPCIWFCPLNLTNVSENYPWLSPCIGATQGQAPSSLLWTPQQTSHWSPCFLYAPASSSLAPNFTQLILHPAWGLKWSS